MIQSRSGAGLTPEAFERLGVGSQVFRQEFKCNVPPEGEVLGFIHDAHAATAEFPKDAVVREGLADEGVGSCYARHTGRLLRETGVTLFVGGDQRLDLAAQRNVRANLV
jgi:hypothetical protein